MDHNSNEDSVMNEPMTKICAILILDEESQEICKEISREVRSVFPTRILDRPAEDLPYHMTLLGGITVPYARMEETAIRIALALPSFRGRVFHRQVEQVSHCQRNGNVLGLRLFLFGRNRTLTGNLETDQQLISDLCPAFAPDEHISISRVQGGFEEFDLVYPLFREIVMRRRKQLQKMLLTPQIWTKTNGGPWSQYSKQ